MFRTPVRRPARRCGPLVALALALAPLPSAAAARTFSVDDLLIQESLGPTAIDPTGRWLVYERRDPYDRLPSYDYSTRNDVAGSRLWRVDLHAPGPARPLLANDTGPGDIALGFSPDGTRLLVQRLRDHRLDLGVVTLATGAVQWLGLTPEDAFTNRAVQWRSVEDFVVLARTYGDLPLLLRVGSQAAARLPARWATTAAGGVATTVIGSGEALSARARPNPSRLLLVNARTGAIRRLAQGEITDFELAPDGRRVAMLETAEDLQPRGDGPVQGPYGLQTERHTLALIDLASGQRTTSLAEHDILDSLLTWRADGRRLLVYARTRGAAWPEGGFQVVEAATGQATPLALPDLVPVLRLRPERVSAAWMGRDPVILAQERTGGRSDWWRVGSGAPNNLTAALPEPPSTVLAVTDAELQVIADDRAWRLDPRGRILAQSLERVAAATWPRASRAKRLAEVPSTAAGAVRLPEASGALGLAFGAGPRTVLPGDASALAVDTATGAVAAVAKSPAGVERLLIVRPNTAPVEAAVLNVGFADLPPPRLLAIETIDAEGRALRSWLYLPPEPPPGAPPPPLVVRPYLGDAYRQPPSIPPPPGGVVANIRVLVGHGYAVLVPSLPRRTTGEPLDGLGQRVLAIVDAAAAQPELKGAFDPQRLALWGHSYGGYTVLGLLTQTDRFKAAVAVAAPSNLFGMWGTFQPNWRVSPEDGVLMAWPAGWTETAQAAMGAPPWAVADRYVRNSPALLADRIRTPLLLLHGDQDAIPVTQSEGMFAAMYRQGKTAELVTYWGEDHFLNSPGTVRDEYARGFAWIDRYVGPPR